MTEENVKMSAVHSLADICYRNPLFCSSVLYISINCVFRVLVLPSGRELHERHITLLFVTLASTCFLPALIVFTYALVFFQQGLRLRSLFLFVLRPVC